jgi:hypothetical protein
MPKFIINMPDMESIDLTKELKESKSEHDVKKILVDSYIKETLKKHQSHTRTVQLQITRKETWSPTYEVPFEMTDAEAEQFINDKSPDEVFSEFSNKSTYQQIYLDLEVLK